jgi:hypothetical protein
MKYDEQSAAPGLVGSAEATAARLIRSLAKPRNLGLDMFSIHNDQVMIASSTNLTSLADLHLTGAWRELEILEFHVL